MENFETSEPTVIAVKLHAAAEAAVKKKEHPWVFSDSVAKAPEGKAGDICVIFGSKSNKVIGVGLWDPDSQIRVKMLHYGGPAKLDASFFRDKIQRAFQLRRALIKGGTNSYRLLFGENDGFPGLIADVYHDVLVVKLYSRIWLPFLVVIVQELIAICNCKTGVLRLSRSLENLTTFKDGEVIYGTLENEEVEFQEDNISFITNVIKGHKTGYFLDHRHNRIKAGKYSKGKTVLDVFSYTGGFTVHALAGGAREVTSVDISRKALEYAQKNIEHNQLQHRGRHYMLAGDAFAILQDLIAAKKVYDVVIIDPPSFAKSQDQVNVALKKYYQLAKMGTKLTAPNGLLVLASCSSRVKADAFFKASESAIKGTGRKYDILEKTEHDVDHPVTFPEGAYLKCGYYRLH